VKQRAWVSSVGRTTGPLTLFGSHDRNKCPTVGSRDHFPLGFIAGIVAGIALVDIHVSSLLQFGVGVGSFDSIPTFRLCCVDSQINYDAFCVDSQINSFVQSRHSCNLECLSLCSNPSGGCFRLHSLYRCGAEFFFVSMGSVFIPSVFVCCAPWQSVSPNLSSPVSSCRFFFIGFHQIKADSFFKGMRSSSSVQSSSCTGFFFVLVAESAWSRSFVRFLVLIGMEPIDSLSPSACRGCSRRLHHCRSIAQSTVESHVDKRSKRRMDPHRCRSS